MHGTAVETSCAVARADRSKGLTYDTKQVRSILTVLTDWWRAAPMRVLGSSMENRSEVEGALNIFWDDFWHRSPPHPQHSSEGKSQWASNNKHPAPRQAKREQNDQDLPRHCCMMLGRLGFSPGEGDIPSGLEKSPGVSAPGH